MPSFLSLYKQWISFPLKAPFNALCENGRFLNRFPEGKGQSSHPATGNFWEDGNKFSNTFRCVSFLIFFYDLDFEVVEINGIYEIILIESRFGMALEFTNRAVEPDWLA